MPINDPIAWWRLDDGSGAVALDSSGNGYSLSLINSPTWIEDGQIAGGLNFAAASAEKGETSAAGLLASLQSENSFTVAFWARAAAYQTDAAAFAIRNGVNVGQLLLIYPYDLGGGNGARVFWNSTNPINQNGGEAAVDTWNHFMFVSRSATDHEMFVNNASVGTSADNLSNSATLSHVGIGAWNGGQNFNGDMDDVRIYNRALDASERTELFEWRGDPAVLLGSGGHRKQQPQRRWYSYVEQWLDELEEEEERKAALLKKARAEAAAAARVEKFKREQQARTAERIRQEALEQARRKAAAAEERRLVQEARAVNEAKRVETAAQVQAALARVEARKQQAEALAEEEELRRLRQIARSPHRRFSQRFEAAVKALKRQGWRAKT